MSLRLRFGKGDALCDGVWGRWSVAGTNAVPLHDSRRKGIIPRTAPSFREECITRARYAASRILVVGGEQAMVIVEAMMDPHFGAKDDVGEGKGDRNEVLSACHLKKGA
jgi:hypothetical protein